MFLAAAVLAVGCTGDDDDGGQTAVTTAAPTTDTMPTTETTTGTSSPATTSPTAAPTTTSAPVVRTLTEFRSPTGNIICLLDPDRGVDCEVLEHNFSPPPREPSCDLDWGDRFYVGPVGAGFVCYGDTLRDASRTVLAYGEITRVGAYECASSRDGVRCLNREHRKGFEVSRARYELF